MKIILFPDLHLGKRIKSFGIDPQTGRYRSETILENKLNLMLIDAYQLEPDMVIMPGDIFDSPRPPISAMKVFIEKISDHKYDTVFCISGNHDTPTNSSDTNTVKACIDIIDYVTPEQMQTKIKFLENGEFDYEGIRFQVVGNMVTFPEKIKIAPDIDIVIGHFPTKGPNEYSFIRPPEIEANSETIFLLGDCHSSFHQENIFYSGILERTNFNEADNKTGFWVIDYDNFGKKVEVCNFFELPSLDFLTVTDTEFDENLLPMFSNSIVRYIGNNNEYAKILKESSLGFVYQRESTETPFDPIGIKQPDSGYSDLDSVWNQFADRIKIGDELKQKVSELLLEAKKHDK